MRLPEVGDEGGHLLTSWRGLHWHHLSCACRPAWLRRLLAR